MTPQLPPKNRSIMRKKLNWYSISVIVIFLIACGVLIWGVFGSPNIRSEGEAGLSVMFFMTFYLIILFLAFILLSLVRILSKFLTKSPKIDRNKDDVNSN